MSSSFSLSANEYKLQVFEITQRASPIRSVDSPFPPVEHTASPSSIKASTSHSKSSKILQAANKVARRSRSSPKLLQHPPEAQWIPPSESINDIITTPSVSPQAQQQAPQQRGSRASGFVSKFRLFKARRTSSTASGTERLLISNSSSTTSVNSVQSSKPGLEREGAFAIPYKHATLPRKGSSWSLKHRGQPQMVQNGLIVSGLKRSHRAMTVPSQPVTPAIARCSNRTTGPQPVMIGLGIEGLEYDERTGKYGFAQDLLNRFESCTMVEDEKEKQDAGVLTSISMNRSPVSAGTSSSSGESHSLRTPTAVFSSSTSSLFDTANGKEYTPYPSPQNGDGGSLQQQQRPSLSSLISSRKSVDSGYQEVVNVLGGMFPPGEVFNVDIGGGVAGRRIRRSFDRSLPEGSSPTLSPVDSTPTTSKAKRTQVLHPHKKEADGRRMRSYTISSTSSVDGGAIRKALKATAESGDSREMLALYAEHARLMRSKGDRA
ncbi:hypothetical protein FRC19_008493 [Serendipita sp. 401]|nr:hypothetical protein FRC19_008493 [Serendipita sp. 401]KAG9053646.1 hypothetical protein FS842_007577 [Serendipita sp. 407]